MQKLLFLFIVLTPCLLNSQPVNTKTVLDTIFHTNTTPVWEYSFLRNTTKEFLETAKGLERDLLNYKTRLTDQQEEDLILRQAISVAELNVDLARIGVRYANQSAVIGRKNEDIAQTRISNKFQQILGSRSTLEFMKKKHDEIASRNIWRKIGQIAGGVTAAAATLASMGLSGAVGAALHLTGAIGGAQAEERNIKDRDAITERQTADQIQQMGRELKELQELSELATEQTRLDEIAIDRASAEERRAREDQQNAVARLRQFLENQVIPEEELNLVIQDVENILRQYLQYSVVLAQLTEKSYRAEEVVASNFISSYEEYVGTGTGVWVAADRILLDLNTMEFSRITQKKQKPNFTTYTLSLRNKDPFQMELLRRTGKMNFDLTQFELDLAFPGTFARTIKRVDVQVIALTEPGGIKGQLTKEGLSWKKVPAGIAGDYALEDWFEYFRSDYKAMVFNDENETLLFPRAANVSQTPGLFDVLEGKPLCGTYTLELPLYANNFDYSSLADVIITIDFASYFDPGYKSLVEAEICERAASKDFINTREMQLSMRYNQPDDWYEFRNPIAEDTLSGQRRYFPIIVERGFIPNNHLRPQLNALAAGILGENGYLNAAISVTSASMNPSQNLFDENGLLDYQLLDSLPTKATTSNSTGDSILWLNNFQPVTGSYIDFIDKNSRLDTVHLQVADSTELSQSNAQFNPITSVPHEVFIIKIEAIRNPGLTAADNAQFDEEKLAEILDIQLNVGYIFSSNFCDFSRRKYAWMEPHQAAMVKNVRGIDAKKHQVPYLKVIERGVPQFKVQDRLTWYKWETNYSRPNNFSFTLDEFIHKDEYADLIPFYTMLGPKTSFEEVEVTFDLKRLDDEITLYCEPSWLRLHVKKGRGQNTVRFEIDQSQVPKEINVDGVKLATSQPYYIRGDVELKFRYLIVPGDERRGKIDVFIKHPRPSDDIVYRKVLDNGAIFYAWRNDFQTNFTLRVHREDYPAENDHPSFILKDLSFYDLSRF